MPISLYNVILLTVDSLRADALLCLASSSPVAVATPTFERLAEQSVVFSQAFSHGPYSPSAFSALFTSRYPREAIIPIRTLRPDCITIAEYLKQAGYVTIGLHSNPLLSGAFGYDRGFDIFEESLLPWNAIRVQHLLPKRVSYAISRGMRVLTRRAYLDAARLNQKALSLLSKAQRPVYLWIHYMDVHGPYQSRKRLNWAEKVRSERLWHKAISEPEAISHEEFELLISGYRDEVAYWDEQFGELLRGLRELGLYDDTIIIVTADHGDEFLEHGGFSHARKLFDELLHVPLLIRIPGESPRRIDRLVGHVDILPTLLELMGLELWDDHLEGRNLLQDEAFATERCLLADATPDRPQARVAARTSRWKYIYDEIEGQEMLFHLPTDPVEQHNLIGQASAEIISPLRDAVASYLTRARSERVERPEEVTIEDQEVIRRLIALGYLDDASDLNPR